ncbi:MAG: hypoxanthine phosphoribosyltransferase [Candidatus Aminicenantia bacterium]
MKKVKVIPLISKEKIDQKIEQLAAQISSDYANENLIMVCILKGAWMFMADLVRKLTIPVACDFLGVSSYGSGTETSGIVKITSDLTLPVEGKSVLIVEDIVDTGLTLNYIKDILTRRKSKTVKICALLDKPERHIEEIKIDYLGFTIPNKFVVGYGIDYDEKYRHLPYIGYIEFEEEEKS